jgi:hypothetical protein
MKRLRVHLHVDDLAVPDDEHFHAQAGIPVFREAPVACCAPAPRGQPEAIPVTPQSSCC